MLSSQAMALAPSQRGQARKAFEDHREVRLGTESHRQSQFGNGHVGRREHGLRFGDAAADQIFMRANARGCAKLRSKVHAAQACSAGDIGKRNRTVEMGLDEFGDAFQSPFGKRGYFSAGWRRDLPIQAKQVRNDRQAEKIRKKATICIVDIGDRQQGVTELLQQRVPGRQGIPESHPVGRPFAMRPVEALPEKRIRNVKVQDVIGPRVDDMRRQPGRRNLDDARNDVLVRERFRSEPQRSDK
jgi:hypothetical protein